MEDEKIIGSSAIPIFGIGKHNNGPDKGWGSDYKKIGGKGSGKGKGISSANSQIQPNQNQARRPDKP